MKQLIKLQIFIKTLFIVPTDANNYKIIGMLKQLKFRQLLRRYVNNDKHNRTIIIVLAKHWIASSLIMVPAWSEICRSNCQNFNFFNILMIL
jgi:hypothetical protein